MSKILIDLNDYNFQSEMFELQKDEQRALLNTLKKISKLNWSDFYKDKGIRWELIKQNQQEDELYSFRFSQKYRGTAYRQDDYMVLVGLFTDHDGAYK
jgi:hypothetical protein